ncbi:MFS transporter [Anaerostipes sp. Marseille-Q3525]|uniref:MFS transporter n=1 Tax=Anaerostipes sp. Marseille-Q3525 TaxID=2758418 RepID=UPI001BAD55F0|nr:MFS transporter [Anaerostipes sp. Marseille-Q3525]MBR9961452.1 MFS transporter [Anaerostipes sp. Marseille-Q3525]
MNLTKKEKFSFGFGALGKDAICCFVGDFLMFYFTDVLFLAPAFVGTLFFVARIWDAINDPMMGLVVDNTHNRFGKFRTWLLVGTLLNAVAGFVAPTNPLFVILGAGILKLGSGFELGVVTVCIADVIDYNELLFGTRNESIICSTQTFLMKASQAVSGLLTGVGLAMVGYNASLPQQSAATLNGIRIIMIVIPMVFAVISYLIYAKAYKLKGDYLNNMVKELNVVHEA